MNPPTPQPETIPLVKPANWVQYTLVASLKYVLGEGAPTRFPTPDAAKHEIYSALNWLEAHDEYSWPDFLGEGMDFGQSMRLRRALVGDVFIGLTKAGSLVVSPAPGLMGTPDSGQDIQTDKRPVSKYSKHGAGCKRPCKREEESDTEARPDSDMFLADAMRDLIQRSDIIPHKERYTGQGRPWKPDVLADMVNDCLVEKWSSQVSIGLLPVHVEDTLKSKRDAWARTTPTSIATSSAPGAQRSIRARKIMSSPVL